MIIMSVLQSEKIRTVIKTKSLWGPQNIQGSLKAVYTVNKKKHLLSLLTMIGPSPDWCLGELARFCGKLLISPVLCCCCCCCCC